MKNLFLTMLAVLLIAPAAHAQDLMIPVDGDFNDGEISWTGGHSKSYVYVWDVIESGGKIAICGAGQFTDPSSRMASRDVMRKSKITISGKTILKDLSFFTQVKKSASLASAKATCRVTGAAVPKGNEDIYLETPDGRARF